MNGLTSLQAEIIGLRADEVGTERTGSAQILMYTAGCCLVAREELLTH